MKIIFFEFDKKAHIYLICLIPILELGLALAQVFWYKWEYYPNI